MVIAEDVPILQEMKKKDAIAAFEAGVASAFELPKEAEVDVGLVLLDGEKLKFYKTAPEANDTHTSHPLEINFEIHENWTEQVVDMYARETPSEIGLEVASAISTELRTKYNVRIIIGGPSPDYIRGIEARNRVKEEPTEAPVELPSDPAPGPGTKADESTATALSMVAAAALAAVL